MDHDQSTPGSSGPRPPIGVGVIGAGERGNAYAAAIKQYIPTAQILVVAELVEHKRHRFCKTYGVPPENSFTDWTEIIQQTQRLRAGNVRLDCVLICTLDWQHAEIAIAMARLGYHILLEKPLSTTWPATLSLLEAVRESKRVFAIGHVLRYSPFNILLKRLISEQKVVGKIMNLQHTERVGWWHFAHSYVRGNWRRSGKGMEGEHGEKITAGTVEGAPSLLTKSCHDLDLIFWLLNEKATSTATQAAVAGGLPVKTPSAGGSNGATDSFIPSALYSTGSLSYFNKAHKPPNSGTHCLDCPIEPSCIYSAKRIYVTHGLDDPTRKTGWPVSVLVPDIENFPSARDAILSHLSPSGNSLYGRCVWDIPDNDVCDNQSVAMTFPSGVLAQFNMTAFTGTICKRHTVIYGTHGELHADAAEKIIQVHTFADNVKREYRPEGESQGAHGGGDAGLAKAFLQSVWLVEREGWQVSDAQRHGLGVDLDEIEMSHRGIWLAEKSRQSGRIVTWDEL